MRGWRYMVLMYWRTMPDCGRPLRSAQLVVRCCVRLRDRRSSPAVHVNCVRLAHGLNFIAYGLNLNNEVFGFYQGSPQYPIQREYYKPTFAMGVRWNLTSERD